MSTDAGNGGGDETDLDWLSDSILMELRGRDGEATTPELVELTGAETRQQILYRVNDKLEPQGLVETEFSEEHESGPIPPKLVRLTTRGDGLAGQLISGDGESDGSLGSEISQLQSQVNQLQSTVQEQQELIEKLMEGHDDLVNWIEDVEDDVDYLLEQD